MDIDEREIECNIMALAGILSGDSKLYEEVQAGVRYSIDHPDVYIESNIIGFYNLLEACCHNPVEHLVYASSSSVYGGNKKVPFSTEDKVDNPVSLYAATKINLEPCIGNFL